MQDRLIALHHLDVGWKPSDLEQREGRIIRQGNMNPKVKIYRYVTEGTFDSFMWQSIESKQKFISQIMISKSPVRSCEDVEVSKLKLLKANFVSNQYHLEDDIVRNFPQQIAKLTESIKEYQTDISHYQANKITDPENFQMQVGGKVFYEKKEAGTALLAMCKTMKQVDSVLDVGMYQGFSMRMKFDSWSKEFVLSLKHEIVSNVRLGSDELGNITRINNVLEGLPQKLAEAKQKLEMVNGQLDSARAEVGKAFPKEEELDQMLERLAELNALLNMDEKETETVIDAEAEEVEGDEVKKPSIHDRLNAIKENNEGREVGLIVSRATEVCG